MPRQSAPTIELPTLDGNIHLLEAERRTSGALQSLVLDHLLSQGTDAMATWIDSRGNASTQPLAQLAPSPRLLDRIEIARGFTAFQHYSLLDELHEQVTEETSLLVLPDLDWFYRDGDLNHREGERMLSEGIALVEDVHDKTRIPVLVTRTNRGEDTSPIECAAEEVLRCEQTSQGPRFTGSDFETLVYPGRGYFQTTITYWNRILTARHPELGESTVQPEVATVGTD